MLNTMVPDQRTGIEHVNSFAAQTFVKGSMLSRSGIQCQPMMRGPLRGSSPFARAISTATSGRSRAVNVTSLSPTTIVVVDAETLTAGSRTALVGDRWAMQDAASDTAPHTPNPRSDRI